MEKEAVLTGAPAAVDPYEADLVARAKERDPRAWDEIYSRNYPPIYRYVRARVFEDAGAEDLASTVFLAAVKGIDSYRYGCQPLLAWLYGIARNVVSSHQRTIFKQRTLSIGGVLELPGRVFGHNRKAEPAGPTAADPSSQVEQLDLREALAELPESQKEVLVLKFFLGLDAKEIAGVVGKDPAAVYSLQARGLQTLRRRLG